MKNYLEDDVLHPAEEIKPKPQLAWLAVNVWGSRRVYYQDLLPFGSLYLRWSGSLMAESQHRWCYES